MKVAKPVLFAVILSFIPLTIAQTGHASQSRLNGPSEPSESVSGLATLVATQDSAEGRFALLRISLVANTSDAAATVHEFDQARKSTRGLPIASLDLRKGEASSFIVRVAVPRDQQSHLFYKVKARTTGGSSSELTLYTPVPSTDTDPCQAVGEYIQCEGEAVAAVEP